MSISSGVPEMMLLSEPDYRRRMLDLLEAVRPSAEEMPDRALCLFAPRVARQFDGKLMVVGRAVNGWIHLFDRTKVGDATARDAFLNTVAEIEGGLEGAMAWVEGSWPRSNRPYSTSRSAFWRVIGKVASGLGIGGVGWSERIAWTNLYRVSPASTGNPVTALREAQLEVCRHLLRYEIDRLHPEIILVLAGRWWFKPFKASLGANLAAVDKKLIEALGQVGDSRVIVAPHPQGRPEAVLVQEIMEAVGKPSACAP